MTIPITSCLPDHVLDCGAFIDKFVVVWADNYLLKNTAFTPIRTFCHCEQVRFGCTGYPIRSIGSASVIYYPTFKVKMEVHQ